MRKAMIIVGAVLISASVAMAAQYRNVISSQAKALIEKGAVFLLDVRTPQEYQQAHLQGAVLIPVDQIEKRIGEIPKNRPVMVYCAVGSRSSAVAGLLAEKGYRDVYNMKDGIVGWYRNGLPIVR